MTSAEFTRNRDNFCYRHPDRQSFVLCQRCLRTVCPECQTQGAVGVICPECMAQQRADQTPAQKQASKRWARSRSSVTAVGSSRPLVTYTLIAITTGFFILGVIPGIGPIVESALAFNSVYLVPAIAFEPWRMVTVTLVHSGLWHIALNMLALWVLGRSLEPLLGRWRFLALYVLSAIGGSVLVTLLAPGTWVVGASGAIWGLLGAIVMVGRHLGARLTPIFVLLGINLVFTFLPGSGISWQAHIGGGLTGLLVGFIYTRTRRPSQRRQQIWLLVAVAVGLVALAMIPALLFT